MTLSRVVAAAALVAVVVAVSAFLLTRGGTDTQPYGGIAPRFGTAVKAPAQGTEHGRIDGAPDKVRQTVQFLRYVSADVQGFWQQRLADSGLRYVPTQIVIFHRRAVTGCGRASSATGPFYCPVDEKVYLDLSFFRALAVEFHAPGDFADAYVVAHEIGHHVQDLWGILPQVAAAQRQDPALRNPLSIRVELMADCLAGVWAHSTYERGLATSGDLQEALRAAAAVGDDRIQAATTGVIQPESWTHGSSAQRVTWLSRGFETGDPQACDTFASSQI